jgi:hypothetical protein
VPATRKYIRTTVTRLLAAALLGAASWVSAQEVAEIPFFSASPGTAALGAGFRLGQSAYLASDNEDRGWRPSGS